jgi:membrane protease YdiL (CAAX protease family)
MPDPEREPLDNSATAPADDLRPGDVSEVVIAPSVIEWQPVTPRIEAFPPWSGWDVFAVLGFTMATVFLFSMMALGVAHVLTSKRHVPLGELATNPIVLIGSQVVAYPVVIFFMMTLVRTKSSEGFWKTIRWNWPGRRALGFVASGMVFALAVELVSRYLPIPKSLPIDKYFSEVTGAYLMAGFGVTLAPMLEELFFRGLFYPLARRTVGVTPAVLLTATLFAFIHGAQLGYAWAPLLSIFVVGVVFTVVRERTGSVASSFLTHCGYNLTLFGLLWFGSDGFRHLEKVAN